jgi:hypothetical protein
MIGQRDWLFQQEASRPRAVGETLMQALPRKAPSVAMSNFRLNNAARIVLLVLAWIGVLGLASFLTAMFLVAESYGWTDERRMASAIDSFE